jgi:hypothetical protein
LFNLRLFPKSNHCQERDFESLFACPIYCVEYEETEWGDDEECEIDVGQAGVEVGLLFLAELAHAHDHAPADAWQNAAGTHDVSETGERTGMS